MIWAGWWKRPPVLAGVGTALLGLLLVGLGAGGVFKVKTKDGTIVLENLPADADVTVDGGTVTVKSADGKTFEVGVAPGKKHRLEVKKDGFNTSYREIPGRHYWFLWRDFLAHYAQIAFQPKAQS